MSFARIAFVLVAFGFFGNGDASAESKWSPKQLVPSFKAKETAPRGLYPEPKGPSVWRKMNDGTKSFFAKSKRALPSWMKPKPKSPISATSSRTKRSGSTNYRETRTARRNLFSPWPSKKAPAARPETVSDFLALPKPE